MRERLLALPKITILDVFKQLNGGAVGFDHERAKKSECVDRLTSLFSTEQICVALNGLPQPDVEDVTPRAPQPTVKTVGGDANDALAALRGLLGVQIDADSVRQLVLDEVKKAMDKSPVVKIEVTRPDGTEWKADGHVRPEFQDIMTTAMCGLNILLVGPAGSGKTHLAHQVAQALGREFASISCTAGMSESALQGWMLPSDGGAFNYVPSDFVRMYEDGGVFLFDEVDAADPNTLLFINQALANGSFFLPQRKGATKVLRHTDFVCIAAANTFGTGANMVYAGRERLDESTLDRFRAGTVMLDYDKAFERKVVDPDLLAWGWVVRKKITDCRLSRVMSTRFLLDATKLIKAGRSFEQVKKTYFTGWKADEQAKVEV
ncbi:ATPase-like protein [uncultured Caudovirales phage]|uniref:ATPase-like protein n=1 Tax=uncultured Caudovirales phage TaxID=2100421 RepID=A0A6J5RLW1_9CAUD|nr:ATPase-like protein [uncultured Caudovirales phage]